MDLNKVSKVGSATIRYDLGPDLSDISAYNVCFFLDMAIDEV